MVSETGKFYFRIGAFVYNIFAVNLLIATGTAFIYDDSAITDREAELTNLVAMLFFALAIAALRLTCSVLYPKIKSQFEGAEVDVWGHMMSIGCWTTILHFAMASTVVFWTLNDAAVWTYFWFGLSSLFSMSLIATYVVGLKKALTPKVYLV